MKIIIIGATSAIAYEIAKQYAEEQHDLVLVARHPARLETLAADLTCRSQGSVQSEILDLNEIEKHSQLLKHAEGADVVIIAYGSLPNQKACENSVEKTLQELNTNFVSVVSLLTLFANVFEKKQKGTLAVITSVAGDRGRQSNYVYGAAKGGLSLFLQGLRNRLAKSNVDVITIKPGFVDTPMTKDFKKGLLWSSPDFVARKIIAAIDKKKSIIYVPFFWRYIMFLVRAIPEKIFCKMSM